MKFRFSYKRVRLLDTNVALRGLIFRNFEMHMLLDEVPSL